MKYLKYFEELSSYESYKNGDDLVLPNVSYVAENDSIFYNLEPSISSYNMVDLGLPSGLLWADRNVGASSPEDTGLYFQWGDTVGYTADQVANGEKKFASDYSDYFDTTDGGNTFNKYNNIDFTIIETSDDAATVNMGSEYRMPTEVELEELINNTTVRFIDLQGNEYSREETFNYAIPEWNLKGIKLIGSNNNSIFIPASGYCRDSDIKYVHYNGCVWSASLDGYNDSSVVYQLFFRHNGEYEAISDMVRYCGYTVRGVKEK